MAIAAHRPAEDAFEREWHALAWQPWAWAAASLIGYLASGVAALWLAAWLGALVPLARPLVMPGIWTLLAALAVMGAARLAFGSVPRVSGEAAALAGAGAAFATASNAGLHAWANYRFGYFDPDMIGVTVLFAPLLVAVAVAGFAALTAPPRAGLPAALAALAAAVSCALVVAANLPGLSDGLEPESVIPALAMGAAAPYVALVAILAAWSWLRPAR